MKPTIGRIVHYLARDTTDGDKSITCAAMVIGEPDDDLVSLMVFHPSGGMTPVRAGYSERPRLYHWSWPPRV